MTAIADAIRAKTHRTSKIIGYNFAAEIEGIPQNNYRISSPFTPLALGTSNLDNAYAALKALDKDTHKKVCSSIRKDGKVIEIAGDYTETLARLKTSPSAVGVFGLGFYDQNRDRLRVATVNNVAPSENTILNGSYPVSRPLFFYVKGEHLKSIKGLQQFTEYFLSKKVSGKGSKLERAGLISMSDKERAAVLATFKAGKAVVVK